MSDFRNFFSLKNGQFFWRKQTFTSPMCFGGSGGAGGPNKNWTKGIIPGSHMWNSTTIPNLRIIPQFHMLDSRTVPNNESTVSDLKLGVTSKKTKKNRCGSHF